MQVVAAFVSAMSPGRVQWTAAKSISNDNELYEREMICECLFDAQLYCGVRVCVVNACFAWIDRLQLESHLGAVYLNHHFYLSSVLRNCARQIRNAQVGSDGIYNAFTRHILSV